MRVFQMVLCGVVVGVSSAFAQIDFSANVPNREVLVCEPIPVVATIKNNRMDPLQAGSEQGYSVAFEVTDSSGLLIRPMENATVAMPAAIEGQSEVVFTNDLQRIFPVGRYPTLAVRARLTVGNKSFVTKSMYVDIMPGMEIMRIHAPAPDGEIHSYSLRSLSRDKRDRLFLRIGNESDTVCYGLADLGRFMRIGKPTIEVDGLGRVHILHLSGPGQFIHSVFDAAGTPISRDTVQGELSLVRLVEDGKGSFRVAGGGVISAPRDPIPEALPVRRGL